MEGQEGWAVVYVEDDRVRMCTHYCTAGAGLTPCETVIFGVVEAPHVERP
jgi:hypothetical protein